MVFFSFLETKCPYTSLHVGDRNVDITLSGASRYGESLYIVCPYGEYFDDGLSSKILTCGERGIWNDTYTNCGGKWFRPMQFLLCKAKTQYLLN